MKKSDNLPPRGSRAPKQTARAKGERPAHAAVPENDASTMRESGETGSVLVPAADRALRIFETFERIAHPLSLSKLAEEIEAPISSCHNLVRTLIGRGYLYSLESQRAFYPTGKLWVLGRAFSAHDPVLQRILPIVEQLRNATSETVIVGKRQDHTAMYLLVLEGSQSIRYVARVGRTIPMHTSAVGKALLSALDDKELNRWLGARRLEQVTPHSITDRDELRRDIHIGKQRGYFMTAGENVADVGAIASPIELIGELFAIAVAGPTPRIEANRQRILRSLKETVDALQNVDT